MGGEVTGLRLKVLALALADARRFLGFLRLLGTMPANVGVGESLELLHAAELDLLVGRFF
jgi:hypothetical protein